MGTFQDALWLQNTATYSAAEDRYLLCALYPRAGVVDNATFDNALKVSTSSGLTISVASGVGVVRAASANALQAYLVAHIGTSSTYTLPASPTVNPRWDVVLMTVTDTADGDGTQTTVISHVSGSEAATPSYPTIPAKSVALGAVRRTVGQVTIASTDIVDVRNIYLNGDRIARTTLKSNSTARSSTTTLAIDNELTVAGLTPGRKYKFKYTLYVGGEDAGDFKYQFKWSSGTFTSGQHAFGATAPGASAVGNGNFLFQLDAASPSNVYVSEIADSLGVMVIHEGILDLSSTLGVGVMEFWWAQNSSNAVATTLYANSHVEVTRVN